MQDSVSLSPIILREFDEPDRVAVQAEVVRAVLADPERFLQRYLDHPDSHQGRYVSADLFKEMFDQFAESKEARGRYNAPVHNAAAVLSAEQFRRGLEKGRAEGTSVWFLTGIPGAGKTSTIVRSGKIPDDVRLVFEGQLSKPRTSIEKIGMVIEAGLRPVVLVVHPRPENALDNTVQRFVEYGRGAGIGVMADIQGNLPNGLHSIHSAFGDRVELVIKDVRDRNAVATYIGWDHLSLLRSEGNRDQIYERLVAALERQRSSGAISDAAYSQAYGRVQPGYTRLAGEDGQGHRGDAPGRGGPEGSREAYFLTLEELKSLEQGLAAVASVAPIILPDRTQAERLAAARQVTSVVRSGEAMAARLAATFKSPDIALALVDNALGNAPATLEREHVQAHAMRQVMELELRGSDRLLDFEGRSMRNAAKQAMPATLESIKDYALCVEHHAKQGDLEHIKLQKQGGVSIPDASPELRALLIAPDAQTFAARMRAGDKEEILGNAESIIASIEARIGNAQTAEDGTRLSVSEGQLAGLQAMKTALRRVETKAQMIEESPSIHQSVQEGPRLVR